MRKKYTFCARRNVVGIKGANSAEMEPTTAFPLVVEMPEHNPGRMGGTMRLGRRTTLFQPGKTSILSRFSESQFFSYTKVSINIEINL